MASPRHPQIAGRPLAVVWGKSLKARRLELSAPPPARPLSVADVAALAGITSQALWLFERGDRIPLDRTKVALAKALGTKPETLFPWPDMADLVTEDAA